MRVLVFPLSALAFAVTLSAQTNLAVNATPPGSLFLPATLKKTIKADKVREGASLKLRLEEPVLLGHGVVIPGGAQLTGHVLAASKLDKERASTLAILVDSAEWKQQKVPLHAFVSGVVTFREISESKASDWRCQAFTERASTATRSEKSSRSQSVTIPKPIDCNNPWPEEEDRVVRDRKADLRDVVLHRNLRDGSTFLFSQKRNVKLPGGILLMLHNVPVEKPSAVEIISQK